MYIDIHKHGKAILKNTLVLRNIFPEQISEIEKNKIYSIGLHPWFVNNDFRTNINLIAENCKRNEVIAIGETGLDLKVDIPYNSQIEAFEKQIEIAEKNKLPVIIHCVRAYNDLIKFRKRSDLKVPWIIHWYNASNEIAKELISLNCYLSYGCMLFNETSKAFNIFSKLPINNLFFETDDTEYSISEVYEKASILLKIPENELINQIKNNFYTCFKISI